MRLAVRELETASVDLRARIGEIAAALPEDEVALAVPTLIPRRPRARRLPRPRLVEASAVEAAVEPPGRRAPAVDAGRRRAGVRNVAAATGRPTMRRFFAQVVVNALTILLVLFLFSLIKVDYTDPFTGLRFTGPALALGANPLLTLVFMALFVALVGAFVRPIILVLTGRLLLRSMGLILIVVNVFLVAVAGWLAPGEFVVAQPTWFWGTLIALVFTLLASGIRSSSASTGRRST